MMKPVAAISVAGAGFFFLRQPSPRKVEVFDAEFELP
jgi:hypothetical protein